MTKRVENDFNSFPPNKLECWDKVRVTSYNNNCPNHFSKGESRHIHTNAHVYTLLTNI